MPRIIQDDVFEIIELLRNGAMISGNDHYTNYYRTRCLEQAYFRIVQDLSQALIDAKLLTLSAKLVNLLDVNVLYQKNAIQPELIAYPKRDA